MADDVAVLMQEIGVQQADILGYSMGGSVALQIAMRHPEQVDKLVVISTTYNSTGSHPEIRAFAEFMTPEIFAGTPVETDYLQLAPDPQGFATLVEKLVVLETAEQDWPPESIAAIAAPTLIIVGDSDSVQLDHAVEMFRLRGGGIEGDLNGLPASRLAILPGTTHLTLLEHVDMLSALTTEFLDATTTE
jgi:pimeloyl-ACP methyl ester carboxylesterase